MPEKGAQQESQMLSGPGESSNTPSKNVNPWSGRLRFGSPNVPFGSAGSKTGSTKGKKKEDQPMAVFDASHSSGDESLDEEFGTPRV